MAKTDDEVKAAVLPLLYARHGTASMVGDRRKAMTEKLEGFVDRAIERGLTMKLVEENITAGRPPHWLETGE